MTIQEVGTLLGNEITGRLSGFNYTESIEVLFIANTIINNEVAKKKKVDDIPISPPTTTPPVATKDKWGITMLNPTQGREWYINMTNPEAPGEDFDRRSGTMVSRPDGSWFTDGAVRLYVYSPSPKPFWKNVEMTGYHYIEVGTSGTIQNYSRGGIHTEQQYKMSDGSLKWGMAMGSKLASRIYIDGSCKAVKEIGHSVYSSQSRGARSAGVVPNLVGPRRWFGLKTIITEYKTASGAEGVRIKSYIDDNAQDANGNCTPKNNWKPLVIEALDDGTWNCDSGSTESTMSTFKGLTDKCGVPPGMSKEQYAKMALTWVGHPVFTNDANTRKYSNCVSWRWDNLGIKCKYLSAREIVPYVKVSPITNL